MVVFTAAWWAANPAAMEAGRAPADLRLVSALSRLAAADGDHVQRGRALGQTGNRRQSQQTGLTACEPPAAYTREPALAARWPMCAPPTPACPAADNWSVKAIRRKTTGTGRMRHLKTVQRRFSNGFREGERPLWGGIRLGSQGLSSGGPSAGWVAPPACIASCFGRERLGVLCSVAARLARSCYPAAASRLGGMVKEQLGSLAPARQLWQTEHSWRGAAVPSSVEADGWKLERMRQPCQAALLEARTAQRGTWLQQAQRARPGSVQRVQSSLAAAAKGLIPADHQLRSSLCFAFLARLTRAALPPLCSPPCRLCCQEDCGLKSWCVQLRSSMLSELCSRM